MWFQVTPSDLSFCEGSRHRFVNVVRLPFDAGRAFDHVASSTELPRWLEDCVSCEWTSPEPYGVGSTRDVKLKMLAVKERFLAWDRGKRFAFTAVALSIPLLSRMVEDIQLRELAPGETELTWTVHYEPRLVARPVHPIARYIFRGLLARSAANLERLFSGQRVAH